MSATPTLLSDCARRWRRLGGVVALGSPSCSVYVPNSSEDDATLRADDWVHFLRPKIEPPALVGLGDPDTTPVLRASASEGVQLAAPCPSGDAWKFDSWGDYEIEVDRLAKSPTLNDLPSIVLQELKSRCRPDRQEDRCAVQMGGGEEVHMLATMLDSYSCLKPLEGASWDDVLEKLGEGLEPEMFGAGGTTPAAALQFENDGNSSMLFVDVGDAFYRCTMETS